jgi:hypothetical protein
LGLRAESWSNARWFAALGMTNQPDPHTIG